MPRTAALLLLLVFGVCHANVLDIVRPCHFANHKCIGDNLKANSECRRNVPGTLPAEYTIPRFQFETPYFNSTYVDNNLIIRNHHKCRVSEFFFNMKADSAVLGIDCPYLELQSNRSLIQHRPLQEDTSFNYAFHGVYPLIRLTLSLRHANDLNICTGTTFADVTALPIFKINPNDIKTANFLSRDLTFLNIFERESFFWRANQLARYYINSVLCDFGCNF